MHRTARVMLSLSAVLFTSAIHAVAQAPAGIAVELNKLEDRPDGACRGYFVVTNNLKSDITKLELDIFLFDRGGTIIDRVVLGIGSVKGGRSRVVLFDLTGQNPQQPVHCSEISRLLLNDVITCADESSPIPDCAAKLEAMSRTKVSFQ